MLLVLICAQEVAAPSADANQLQRIRKALEAPPPPSLVAPAVSREGPVFRARIEAFDLGPAWKDRSMVPPYVRTWFRPYHHEYLERVTPEEFRAATLAPYGIPFDQVVGYFVKEIKAARRASQEKRARDVVARELAAFLACQADPRKPGCTPP